MLLQFLPFSPNLLHTLLTMSFVVRLISLLFLFLNFITTSLANILKMPFLKMWTMLFRMKIMLWPGESERSLKNAKCKMSGSFQSSLKQTCDPSAWFQLLRRPPFLTVAVLYSILQARMMFPCILPVLLYSFFDCAALLFDTFKWTTPSFDSWECN